MKTFLTTLLVLSSLSCVAWGEDEICTNQWYQTVDQKLQSGDGHGHGPDIGGDEWKSVVEFRLGLRGNPEVPERSSKAWCEYIQTKLMEDDATAGKDAAQKGPSFSCEAVKADSIESIICNDAELSQLDRSLSAVYSQALSKASNEQPPTLKAMQRGWIKGRDECWKADDKRDCVKTAYVNRIAELQASYRLVKEKGPYFFYCDGNRAKEVVVTYFETNPLSLIAEFGDSTSLMFAQTSASGTRYQGRNESYWEHQGEARVVWGYDAPEMKCKRSQ